MGLLYQKISSINILLVLCPSGHIRLREDILFVNMNSPILKKSHKSYKKKSSFVDKLILLDDFIDMVNEAIEEKQIKEELVNKTNADIDTLLDQLSHLQTLKNEDEVWNFIINL